MVRGPDGPRIYGINTNILILGLAGLGLLGPRTIGPSDYRALGLTDPRTNGPSDYRALGIPGYCRGTVFNIIGERTCSIIGKLVQFVNYYSYFGIG